MFRYYSGLMWFCIVQIILYFILSFILDDRIVNFFDSLKPISGLLITIGGIGLVFFAVLYISKIILKKR